MSDVTETVAEQTKKGWAGFSKFMLISTTTVLAIVALMALFLLQKNNSRSIKTDGPRQGFC